MDQFVIKKASRQGVKPLIGLYGKSGGGKTMSALLLARGIAGPTGRVTLIDSESGRGSLFADLIPGGYNIVDIEPPFSPERYQAAFEYAEGQSDVVVIDSLSHEHCGEGGILDMQEAELERMAGSDWGKREKCKMAAWIKPKAAHKKFIQRLLRCKVGLICCLRGEEKTHMIKGGNDKGKVVTDEFSTPIYDQRFIFELLLNGETVSVDGKGGFVYWTKLTHPAVAACLPKSGEEQIGVKHGEALAKWCANPSSTTPSVKPSSKLDDLKKELWKLTQSKHQGVKSELQQWLIDEAIIADNEKLDDLTESDLVMVIEAVKRKGAK